MSTEPSSLMKALEAEAGSAPFSFLPSPEQLDLLAARDGRVTREGLRELRAAQRANGPGRPEGALNRRSKDLARWFVGQFGDPLSVLGEIMNMPADLLYQQMVAAQGGEAKSKRVTGADALRLKVEAAKEALPYIHGKQPTRVDITRRADVILNIEGLTDPAHLAEHVSDSELTEDDIDRLEYHPFEPVEDAAEGAA